jgi:DNA polymerase III epsilon subunit-like protein
MTHYIVIDTETTGLPDYTKPNPWPKPISVGIVHCALVDDDMHIYFEKEWYITDWAHELTDNTAKFLKLDRDFILKTGVKFQVFQDWLTLKLHTLKNVVFVAHNATFDKNVLKHAGITDIDKIPWFCTMNYSTRQFQKYPKLSELAAYHNISMSDSLAHTALYDAEICTQILYSILTNYKYTTIYNRKELKLRNRTVDYYV